MRIQFWCDARTGVGSERTEKVKTLNIIFQPARTKHGDDTSPFGARGPLARRTFPWMLDRTFLIHRTWIALVCTLLCFHFGDFYRSRKRRL